MTINPFERYLKNVSDNNPQQNIVLMKKYKEYSKADFASINKEMLSKWEAEKLFEKSLKQREGFPRFVFYDGPPSANGVPGIHHVVARSLKDIFCRYKAMKGFCVERRAGWDTHGLPVELGVEKLLGINKLDIGNKISIEDYNAKCRSEVMRYTKEWELLTKKMGYWVDMKNPYITYDTKYMETLWWLLKRFYDKGLLYKGFTIQPYSPAAGTGLSSHELNMPGCYRDVKDTVCTAQFKIINPKEEWTKWGDAYFMAWTTTPWTLPSNTALCVGDKIEYVAVETFNPYTHIKQTVLLASSLLASYFKEEAKMETLPECIEEETKNVPWRVIGHYLGKDLVGFHYEQLIPWVIPEKGALRVISGDFVTTEDGTGIVHIAPTFGADDRMVAIKEGIPSLMIKDKEGILRPMVDLAGRLFRIEDIDEVFAKEQMNLSLYNDYQGRFVKNAYDKTLSAEDTSLDIDISVMLKQQNKVFKIEKHIHSYPHCWRTDKPILYYPLDSWFIKTTAIKDEMIALNHTIQWKPESIGAGRFGNWLENIQDWNLSRSRYWGTPLNIWRTEEGDEERCIGSVKELYDEIENSIKKGLMTHNPFEGFKSNDFSKENYQKVDLHRPIVDNIILASQDGRPMYREKDLIDVWFDSGAMPFAQEHYPFENKNRIEKGDSFPADFIAEGLDQTRGWFYTLHAIATMACDSVAYKTVLVNGLVQAKDGNKMSKRLGNAVDPFETIDQFGSDPLRWYLITNAQPWDNIRFDPNGIKEVSRKFFGTLYNTYQFFALYANLDAFNANQDLLPNSQRPEIDRWIRSELHSLVALVTEDLDQYEPTKAARRIEEFVLQQLSNWYVRLSRRRFWLGEMTTDKLAAYQTLFECLTTLARLVAPFIPFYADALYRDLMKEEEDCSVHLVEFPKSNNSLIDKKLEENMQRAQQISSMVLALRRKVNIKVRYPLATIMIPVANEYEKESINAVSNWILSEVNVKKIHFVSINESIWQHQIKPDFRKLGARFGKLMKSLSKAISSMSNEDILRLEKEGDITLVVEGESCNISKSEVEISVKDIPGWQVATEGTMTVALDVTLTKELQLEGMARELVNRLQNLRKQLGFEVNDRIQILLKSGTPLDDAVKAFKEYIQEQVQATSLLFKESVDNAEEVDFEEFKASIALLKV